MSEAAAVVGTASTVAIEGVLGWHVLTVEQFTLTRKLACKGQYFNSTPFAVGGHRWLLEYNPSRTRDHVFVRLRLERTCGGAVREVKAKFAMCLLDGRNKGDHNGGDPVPGTHRHSSGAGFTFVEGATQGFLFPVGELVLSGALFEDRFSVRCDVTVFRPTNKGDGCAVVRSAKVPLSDLGRHIGDLLLLSSTNEIPADVTLEVDDGETFPAHRYILAARSPVFKAQLFGPMRDTTDAARVVRVVGVEARVLKAFLHFVYTDSLPAELKGDEVDDDFDEAMAMTQHLLVAADRYGMERMKLVCEDKLFQYIETTTVGTILTLAEQHGCDMLKQACLGFLTSGSNLKEAMETDDFDHFAKSCPSVLIQLLAKLAM